MEILRLALNLDLQDRLLEAEMVAQRALAIFATDGLTENRDIVAASNMVLVHLYHRQGRLAQSETLATRALADLEKARPVGHPGIALLRTLLARVYASLKVGSMRRRRYSSARWTLRRRFPGSINSSARSDYRSLWATGPKVGLRRPDSFTITRWTSMRRSFRTATQPSPKP